MARNNEPAFRRKTPLLICSIRTEIPYPCVGSSANVFRMSISSVPWTRSLGLLSGIKPSSPWLPRGTYASSTGCQEEKPPKFMRKRPENSWRQANSQGFGAAFWRKDGIERGTKNGREAGMGTWPLRFELLLICDDRLRCDDFNVVPCTRSEPRGAPL